MWFFHKHIHYLGHIISEEGIFVDLEKIKAMMNCPTPKNVTYVIYFMGLASYYKRFIMGFSKVAHPITSFQNKGVNFEWTWVWGKFQLLKMLLMSALILKIVDPNKKIGVYIDACIQGIGGILM